MSSLLEEIRSRIEARLQVGSVVDFDDALLGTQGAEALIAEVMGTRLSLAAAHLVPSADMVIVAGSTSLFGAAEASVEVQLRDEGELVVAIEGRLSASAAASALQAGLLGGLFRLPAGLDSLAVESASITLRVDTRSAVVVLSSDADLEIAGLLRIRQARLLIFASDLGRGAPTLSARFEGLVLVGDMSFFAEGSVGEGSGGEEPPLRLDATSGHFGSVTLVVTRAPGELGAIVLFSLPPDWQFSELSPLLAPLDSLRISFARLVFSSFSSDHFVLPGPDGASEEMTVRKGVSLDAVLELEGGALDFVARLFGLRELPLHLGALLDDLASAEVTAALAGPREIVPGVLVLERIDLAIRPSPFTVTVRGEARVELEGASLPRLRVEVTAAGGETPAITFETAEPWVDPFGVSGLTVNRLALEVAADPVPRYTLLGIVVVGGHEILVMAEITGGQPSALVGSFQGKLSLGEVVRDLVGVGLPPIIDPSIEDFSIQIVSNPLGVTIGDVHFEQGLSLRGTLGIAGLEMFVNVRVRRDQVFAQGTLKKMVRFGDVLEISDTTGSGPPSMTLDTAGSPILKLNGRIKLLGLIQEVEASWEGAGFTIDLREETVGIGTYQLRVHYESPVRFHAEGTFSFALHASIATGIGTIVLDTGFEGTLAVSMDGDRFELVVAGGFSFAGYALEIPRLTLDAAISSLDELPGRVRDLVIERAQDVFQSILEDPAKWVQAILANAIQGVTNVALVLRDWFHQGAGFIAEQLKVLGNSAEAVASALKALGDGHAVVRAALEAAAYAPEAVRDAMQRVYEEVPHQDGPLVPHGDTWLIPHQDIPEGPRVDVWAIPHEDHEGPHVDTGHTDGHPLHADNHGDVGSGPFHVDEHVDAPGPHTDAHQDGPVPPHVDIPPQLHTDGPVPPHHDIPHQQHVDTPPEGHIDIP